MSDTIYSVTTEGAVALAAATAKTIIGVKAAADFGLSLKKAHVALDGITLSAVPGLVEVMYCTWATNGPGTNSTSTTPRQKSGRVIAHGVTTAANWTAEPTVLTIVDQIPLISPAGGVWNYDWSLGDEPDCDLGHGFVIRCNFPAIVNVRAELGWKRC